MNLHQALRDIANRCPGGPEIPDPFDPGPVPSDDRMFDHQRKEYPMAPPKAPPKGGIGKKRKGEGKKRKGKAGTPGRRWKDSQPDPAKYAPPPVKLEENNAQEDTQAD